MRTHPSRIFRTCLVLFAAAVGLLPTCRALGQTSRPAEEATTRPGISLAFPSSVDVKVIVDYVSARTGSNIVYDDELLKKAGTVTIRSPRAMSADQLPDFLSDVLKMKGLALVSDPKTGWRRIVSTAENGPGSSPVVDHFTLKYADASRLAPEIKQLVTATMPGGHTAGFDVSFDARTSQIIAIGPADAVRQALEVAALLDVPVRAEDSPIRFYKLTNATAADVLDTIRGLEGKPPVVRAAPVQQTRDVSSSPTGAGPTGSAFAGQPAANGAGATQSQPAGSVVRNADTVTVQPPSITENIEPSAGNGTGSDNGKLGYESVTADTNTNTIIVRGSAEVQRTYERLIKTLDQRRPQVLLEATVVTLDTTHNFSFGVEFSAHNNGAPRC
jgi:type II secretory pathway component GspD/PulD (secretin)